MLQNFDSPNHYINSSGYLIISYLKFNSPLVSKNKLKFYNIPMLDGLSSETGLSFPAKMSDTQAYDRLQLAGALLWNDAYRLGKDLERKRYGYPGQK